MFGDWESFFAVLPVRVEAYSEEERAAFGGKFSRLKVGRVERRWRTWIDDDDSRTPCLRWEYRIPQ
jgi:hypothetical protein